jgi:hypothetical protein
VPRRFLCFVVLFLLAGFLDFTAYADSRQRVSLEAQIREELADKLFKTKIPLGKIYLYDEGGYTTNLKVTTEIYPDEIKYLTQGGMIFPSKTRNTNTTLTTRFVSGKYVSLRDIEYIPAGTRVKVKRFRRSRDTFDIELVRGNDEARISFKMLTNLDALEFEDAMRIINQALHIEYFKALDLLLSMKLNAEEALNRARIAANKVEYAFEIKQILKKILDIEGLNPVIYSKYEREIPEVDEILLGLCKDLRDPVLMIDSLVIYPDSVKPGDLMKIELKYRIFAPEEETVFGTVESLSIKIGGNDFEVIRKEAENIRGSKKFAVELIVPKDLEASNYSVTAAVGIGSMNRTLKESFEFAGSGY